MSLEIIILAAGQGKRMRSSLPKVLHRVGGKPMLQHLIETAQKLRPKRIHIVVGHGKDEVIETISAGLQAAPDARKKTVNRKINWVTQSKQRGTGHAVKLALADVGVRSTVIVLNGDVPLVTPATLRKVSRVNNNLNLMTIELDNPKGLGRILRDSRGRITAIVEEKDASASEKKIREINTNCLAAKAASLNKWLSSVKSNNAQGEYYLTDAIGCAVRDGVAVRSIRPADTSETLGVNSKADLAGLERIYQRQCSDRLMASGVTVMDPERLDIRGTCRFGNDCTVDINVILEGTVKVGNNVRIGPNTVIRNTTIGHHSVIEANSVIENATIGKGCNIGPFARIRPETVLGDKARIGNFVETKKSTIGRGSKINHLSYVGDSDIGEDVNIGAGVITCNYDGANKYKTVIGNNVFVGSDSQLVAPLRIADGATIGAGSTITSDVEIGALAISRGKQRSVKNWERPRKKK